MNSNQQATSRALNLAATAYYQSGTREEVRECKHLDVQDFGVDNDGGTIYRCRSCGESWNGGFGDD